MAGSNQYKLYKQKTTKLNNLQLKFISSIFNEHNMSINLKIINVKNYLDTLPLKYNLIQNNEEITIKVYNKNTLSTIYCFYIKL